MTDSASLKINRARQHLTEISELLREAKPFVFKVETDTATGERTLGIDQNKAAIDAISIACGDAVHNMRAAIDHAFWEIVSPNAHSLSDKQRRRIQFPFTSKASEAWKTIKESYGHLSGTGFMSALRLIAPHGGPGGNDLLFLIHEFDVRDKHKLLVPSVDYPTVASTHLNGEVPDLPVLGYDKVSMAFHVDTKFKWRVLSLPHEELGNIIPPTLTRYTRKLNLAIDVAFDVSPTKLAVPVIPTLHGCLDACRKTIALMREGAASY